MVARVGIRGEVVGSELYRSDECLGERNVSFVLFLVYVDFLENYFLIRDVNNGLVSGWKM